MLRIGRELWFDMMLSPRRSKKSSLLVHQFLIGMDIVTLEADLADNRYAHSQDCESRHRVIVSIDIELTL
jgi:hypothetical protein